MIIMTILGLTQSAHTAIICYFLATTCGGLNWSGWMANILDVSLRYSGIMYALANTLATIPGIVGSYQTGVMTKH